MIFLLPLIRELVTVKSTLNIGGGGARAAVPKGDANKSGRPPRSPKTSPKAKVQTIPHSAPGPQPQCVLCSKKKNPGIFCTTCRLRKNSIKMPIYVLFAPLRFLLQKAKDSLGQPIFSISRILSPNLRPLPPGPPPPTSPTASAA